MGQSFLKDEAGNPVYNGARIVPPWVGMVTDMPGVHTPPGAFDEVLNFLFTRGRIQTRPRLNSFGTTPDGNKIYLLRSFRDINGNLHTLAVTVQNAYYVTAGPTFTARTFPSGITDLGSTDRPFGVAAVLNRLYFSNGTVKVLYTDGSAALKVAGDVPGGARFLATIGQHLLLGYLHENSRTYPSSVRWSAIGNPNNYNQFTSGANTLIEVPDEITGIVGSSRSGFILRTNGVTMVTPTGIGVAPLAFEHFATEPEGVGCRYPYSLASYGNRFTVFVADDDVYELTLPTFNPIGGAVKRAIFKDIAQATAPITGRIVPGLGVNFDFLSYWLTVPKASGTVAWVYAFENRTWQKVDSASGALTALGLVYTT